MFWIFAAKLYSNEDVGIATALISSMTLLVLITRLGLDDSIIRFFPEKNKSMVFSTSAIITTFFAGLFGLIFIIGIDIWSPELGILKSPKYTIIYMIFLCASSFIFTTDISFIALRKPEFGFYQILIVGTRVLILFFLIYLGAMGILGAVGISFILALIASIIFLTRLGVKPVFKIDTQFLKETAHFSTGNYFAGLFIVAPNHVLTIMVLNVLGPAEAAYYYITFAISYVLFMIPTALSTSLFVEGSHGEGLKKTALRSLRTMFLLLIPSVVVLYFTGGLLLGIVGINYAAHGLDLLRIMIFSSFFIAVCSIFSSIKKVQKDIKELILVNGLIFSLLMILGYSFMIWFGIVGIGYAWVASYATGAVFVGIIAWKRGW